MKINKVNLSGPLILCDSGNIFNVSEKIFSTKNILQWNKISNLFILLLTYFKGGAIGLCFPIRN